MVLLMLMGICIWVCTSGERKREESEKRREKGRRWGEVIGRREKCEAREGAREGIREKKAITKKIGHVLGKVLKDFVNRYKMLRGFRVRYQNKIIKKAKQKCVSSPIAF
jgi:hypothetical protein